MYNQEYSSGGSYYGNNGSNSETPINLSTFERVATSAIGALMVLSAFRNFGRKPFRNVVKLALGGALFYRGTTGYCPVYNHLDVDGNRTESINMRTTFVVNKPKHEVYQFWRKLENLPLFMKHLVAVKQLDSRRSHWEAKIPEGNPVTIKWDAEIVKDEEGSLLSWQSLPGSTIENAGKIEFRDALGNQGTELMVMITYRPPAGNIGSGIAKLLNPIFERIVRQDVNNFKSFIDAGKMTTVAQTSSI